jgi:hypothetical protein
MAQPLNYQLSFGGEKIPEPAPVKKETLISGSTPDQIKLVSGIAQNWVTDYLKSENPETDVSSLGEINYNPNLPVFDNAFPAINDQTDFKALGLEDKNGKVTTKGEQYAELKEMGIITQFGGLSNHGKALLMSEDDALLPENIDIFRAREDIGMYKGEEVGVLKQIVDLSTELATGVQNIVVGAAQYGLGGLAQIGVISDENKAADIAGGVAAIDAFTTGMAKLPMMSEGIADSIVTLVETQMADSEDIAMVQAQHRQDVLRKASLQADYSFLEQVSPVIDFLVDPFERVQPVIGGSIEGAKQTMGDTNYAEFTQPIQGVSQFAPMLLQGPLVPLGLAIQPEMLAIHLTQKGATKLWAAAAAPAARAAFRAGETAKIVRQLEVDASILNAQQSIAITKAEKASNLSASLSEKANTATFTGDVVRSKAAADVAARADALAKSSAAYAENIGGRINNVNEQIAKFQNAYGVADRTLKIADTFRKWPTAAGMVAGWPLEQLGKGLIATRKGVDAVSARTDKIGGMIRLADKLSGLGVGAVGSVFNPMLAVPAAAKVIGKGILALGPVIKGVGSFTRVMGEAASERAASIPFWQKVANFENLNPTQRMLANGFSEFAVAGGYLKRVGSNYAKTYPAFLGLEYLHSGDLETAAKNAIAPTIVIGAPGALLGSAITGSRSNLRKLAHQDMLNFRSRMDPEQRQKFDSMDSGVKRVIANIAESQPGVKFDFTDTGRGRFEESTYTVFINPNSRNPLRPVVTHEFLHYITEAGGATNSINHLLFGNEIGTGGLLKSADGTYDKNYLRFKDEYIKLQEQDDAARRRNGQQVKAQTMDDAYLGMEYFVETQVDRLLRISESGELSRLAGKTQLQRFASKKINELADSMMSRGAFLENLAMRMGSLRDNKGEYVIGNGILADGVRDMPEMRNLFNKLISETSGRRPNATKSMDARSSAKASQGREIPLTDKNDPMIGSMYSDFVFDGNGLVKRDQYGNPERISNDRKKSQESIGLLVADLQAKRIQSGEALLPGELRYDPQAKEWVGDYLTPEQIDVIRNSGFFEQPFIDSLDLVNGAARRGQGEVVNLSYSAATKRNKKMGPSYFSGGVTLREISPIQVRINKAGGIYVKSVDVLQLRANINEVARSKDGARVYEGDVVAICNDVNAVMKLHANDQPTDAYFAKYGAEAQTRKKLINSVFGKTLIDKGINEFSSSAPRSVIKDFRIDRFGKSVLKKGTDGVQVNHKFVRINYLPEGPLRSNDAGDVVVGNPELKAKIEERNRKLGLPPSDGFADTTKPADVNKIQDGFYSQLESVISKKIPTRATPEQIMATIDPTRGSGIKAEEIKWSGIEQALPKLAVDGKVTKEALLKYLADEGNVRFEEVTLRDNNRDNIPADYLRDRQEELLRERAQEAADESDTNLEDKYDAIVRDASQLSETMEQAREEWFDANPQKPTLFSQYVIPGGENYREVVLAMPEVSTTQDASSEFKAFMAEMTRKYPNEDGTFPVWSKMTDPEVSRMEVLEGEANAGKFSQTAKKKKKANYTSKHFPDIPNYVAHMRLDERTLGDGTRTLHSAEYQSDRHQEGRKKGYALTPDEKAEIASLEAKAKQNGGIVKLNAEDRARWDELGAKFETPSVADAPFRTTWPLQLFKRQLRDAVEGGFDAVSWDVGETQNDRFDLSKSLDRVDVFKHGENDYTIDTRLRGGDQGPIEEHISVERVETLLGKDFASKVANQTETRAEYFGDNLKANGSGMRGFYDTMLPKEIGKYVKQWNGKVEKSDVFTKNEMGTRIYEPIWRVDITPEMRKLGQTGQTRYLPEQLQMPEAAGVIGLSQPDKRVITNPSSLWKIMETKDYGGKNSSDYMDVFETKNGGFALSTSSEFPYVEWSQSSAKGKGRTAYLELLYAAKKIGKKGVETQSFAEPEAIGVWKSLERRGLVYLKEVYREDRGDEGIYKVFKATITPKGESFVEGEIDPNKLKKSSNSPTSKNKTLAGQIRKMKE